MLLPNQTCIKKWTGNNRDHYENRGYKFTKYFDEFVVKCEDLTAGSKDIIECTCDMCGKIKQITFQGYCTAMQKYGEYVCHPCSTQRKWDQNVKHRSHNYFIEINSICKNENYTLLTPEEEMINNSTYINYKCKKHGFHKMKISNMLSGRRCPQCAKDIAAERYRYKPEDVIKKVEECGGKVLNSEVYKNQDSVLLFVCFKCGDVFKSSFKHFVQHGGQVCPKCRDNYSVGAKKIIKYFEEHSYDFISEKCFEGCCDKSSLRFDFYLPEFNAAFEFDGQQHFIQSNLFPETLELIQKHDKIKNQYCKDNNIDLIRISYKQINHINDILDNYFSHKDIV